MPWFNTTDYTPVELGIFLTGCSLWVVVYAIYARRIFTRQLIEMPFVAAMSNFAWEILWGFFYHPNMGRAVTIGYQVWCIIDLYIIYGIFRYGHWQVSLELVQRHFRAIGVGLIAFWFLVYWSIGHDGWETPMGAISAYVAQLLISVYYPVLILKTPGLDRFSYPVVWLRTVGTSFTTLFMFIHFPVSGHATLLTLCGSSLVLDVFCVGLFISKRKRSHQQHSLGRDLAAV